MDILIDGYNLLHFAGLARRSYGPGDLERVRHRLVRLIASGFTEQQRPHLTVVFDAKDAPRDRERTCVDAGIPIQFADPGGEADDLIEELIVRHSAPKRLLVVSSDRRLQRAAKRRGAAFIGSEEFLADVERRRCGIEQTGTEGPQAERPKQQGVTSEADLAAWLSEFDDVEIDAITRELDEEEQTRKMAEQQRRTAKKKTRQVAETGSDHNANSAPMLDEIEFWERRIAELFTEENGPPGKGGV